MGTRWRYVMLLELATEFWFVVFKVGWYLGFDRRVSINSDYLRLGTLVQQYGRTVYTAVSASIYSLVQQSSSSSVPSPSPSPSPPSPPDISSLM